MRLLSILINIGMNMRTLINLIETKQLIDQTANDIITRWVNGEVLSTEIWTKLFNKVKSVLDMTKPNTSVKLWRNEYITGIRSVGTPHGQLIKKSLVTMETNVSGV